MAIDIRYRSTFITNVAKQRNSVISTEQAAPTRIPTRRFCVRALAITPISALASIILSAAMLSSPPCWDTTAQSATYMSGVEILSAENRNASIVAIVMLTFLPSWPRLHRTDGK